jgi:hypothetical protein
VDLFRFGFLKLSESKLSGTGEKFDVAEHLLLCDRILAKSQRGVSMFAVRRDELPVSGPKIPSSTISSKA